MRYTVYHSMELPEILFDWVRGHEYISEDTCNIYFDQRKVSLVVSLTPKQLVDLLEAVINAVKENDGWGAETFNDVLDRIMYEIEDNE